MAKNPSGRGGTSNMRLDNPALVLKRGPKKDSKPTAPKPVKIRAEQGDK
jgi:hypothetical protein